MSDLTVTTVRSSGDNQTPLLQPLRIVIPGGEGHLGQLLARRFSSLCHHVSTLTRNPHYSTANTPPKASSLNPRPWKTVLWDGSSRGAWEQSLEGADILINLAGRSVDCRYNARNRAEILQSRVLS